MPNRTIPELSAAGALAGTDVVHIVDGAGNSRRMALADLKTFINTDPTVVPSSVAHRGALVFRSSVLSIPNNTGVNVVWNAQQYNTDSIFSAGAPTRLTVPTGVTKVRLSCQAHYPNATYSFGQISVVKNGGTGVVDYPGGGSTRLNLTGTLNFAFGVATAVVDVVVGDYFELRAIQTSGAARDLQINSWFSMDVVEATI